MSQVDVATSVGYSLKRVTWALRVAMDARLREFDLSVSQYACLELLAHRPGLSNAELARGVFVTRQATHQLLSGLTSTGLIQIHGAGKDQQITLTPHGSTLLAAVSHAVAQIEEKMLAPLSPKQRRALRADLDACAAALHAAQPAAVD
ncbi:DNA-binding MarR family transcriptional regulator [Nakamurella sp. UYEF19]|uniref:MarR family winged helix-turn-helix transcriptional regulator n=1 Tax=Nakamurella sp. UYEF19 TaxID=1756392 RepID=UPI003394BD05